MGLKQTLRSLILLVWCMLYISQVEAAKKQTIVLYQEPPTIDTGIINDEYRYMVYQAVVRYNNAQGKVAGVLYGSTYAHDILNVVDVGTFYYGMGSSSPWPFLYWSIFALFHNIQEERRDRSLTFVLGKNGQITGKGVTVYPLDDQFLKNNKPVTIAITGGTEKYFAANGQVTSVKLNDDGNYMHTLQFYSEKPFKSNK